MDDQQFLSCLIALHSSSLGPPFCPLNQSGGFFRAVSRIQSSHAEVDKPNSPQGLRPDGYPYLVQPVSRNGYPGRFLIKLGYLGCSLLDLLWWHDVCSMKKWRMTIRRDWRRIYTRNLCTSRDSLKNAEHASHTLLIRWAYVEDARHTLGIRSNKLYRCKLYAFNRSIIRSIYVQFVMYTLCLRLLHLRCRCSMQSWTCSTVFGISKNLIYIF